MATITRAQAEKWNAQAKGGFAFDVRHYLIHSGDKELVKRIKQEDGGYIEFRLTYMPEYATRPTAYGGAYRVQTGRHIPNLHISVWHPSYTEGAFSSHGLGDWYAVGEAQDKKNYSVLCKLSGEIDTDAYLAQSKAAS